MPAQPKTAGNSLLAFIPKETLITLQPGLEQVVLARRRVLYSTGLPIQDVYFPNKGIISLMHTFEDGMQAEVGMIGREGMVGQSVSSGVITSFTEAIVQVEGTAFRMLAAAFQRHVEASPHLRSILLRFGETTSAQTMQIAACNARHALEQRLVRLLLMMHDRIDQTDLPLTQGFLASMLSVQRPSVTITAAALQRAGLIRYTQGLITITNRAKLQDLSCECYQRIIRRFEEILPSKR